MYLRERCIVLNGHDIFNLRKEDIIRTYNNILREHDSIFME